MGGFILHFVSPLLRCDQWADTSKMTQNLAHLIGPGTVVFEKGIRKQETRTKQHGRWRQGIHRSPFFLNIKNMRENSSWEIFIIMKLGSLMGHSYVATRMRISPVESAVGTLSELRPTHNFVRWQNRKSDGKSVEKNGIVRKNGRRTWGIIPTKPTAHHQMKCHH